MPNIQHKRGTRAALDLLASSAGLKPGQIYLISDEERIAIALSANSYRSYAKEGETGRGGGFAANSGTGRFHAPDTLTFNTTALAGSAPGTIVAYPFSRRIGVDALGVEVTTAVAGGRIRMGIYGSLGSGMPGSLIEEATEVAADTTGVKLGLLAAPRTIDTPVWLALQWSVAIAMRRGNVTDAGAGLFGSTTFNTTAQSSYVSKAGTSFGAFPASFGAPSSIDSGSNYMLAAREG